MNYINMILNRALIFCFFAFIFWSCQTDMELEIELPEPKKKLVLNSTFTSFTPPYVKPLQVRLWNSWPVLDTSQAKQITDAKILWYENDQLLDSLYFDDTLNAYTLREFYFPVEGANYSIEILKDGYKNISAQNFIPPGVPIQDYKLVSFAGLNNDNLAYSSVSITFNDPEHTENYYEIIVTDVSNEKNKYRLWTNEKIITEEPWYPSVLSFDSKLPQRLLFNDKQINGTEKQIVFYFTPEQVIDKGKLKIRYSIIDIYLRSVTAEYYRYYTTLLQHKYNQKGDFFYGLSEPLNVFTNVENGYGIFAGFYNDAVTIEIDTLTIR